jgi:hypothetical protein
MKATGKPKEQRDTYIGRCKEISRATFILEPNKEECPQKDKTISLFKP